MSLKSGSRVANHKLVLSFHHPATNTCHISALVVLSCLKYFPSFLFPARWYTWPFVFPFEVEDGVVVSLWFVPWVWPTHPYWSCIIAPPPVWRHQGDPYLSEQTFCFFFKNIFFEGTVGGVTDKVVMRQKNHEPETKPGGKSQLGSWSQVITVISKSR